MERITRDYRHPLCAAIAGFDHAKNSYGLITALEERGFSVRALPHTRPNALGEFETLTQYLVPYIACRITGMNAAQIDEFILRRFGIPDYTSSCAPITPGFCWPHSRSASP